jgi:hypothetical protein
MITINGGLGVKLALVVSIISALLMQAAPVAFPPRPPRPTPTPAPLPPRPPRPTSTPEPTSQSVPQTVPLGALIVLYVQFPEKGLEFHWQELWTVVQWQDEFGYWHDVEGWQGTLDEIVDSEDRDVKGRKMWWLASDLFGERPFRWMVYRFQGGELVAKGESFHLPDHAGEIVRIKISLASGDIHNVISVP